MIQFQLDGREVLDLFGGSGQLALEAVSRGARHATVCDASDAAVEIINKNIVKTHSENDCTVLKCEYKESLRRLRGTKFDIVFLDPPYNTGMISSALGLLTEYRLLKATSVIVCESGGEDILAGLPQGAFEVVRTAKYGVAYVTLLKPVL